MGGLGCLFHEAWFDFLHLWVWVEDLSLDWGLIVAVGLCWIVGIGCRSGFVLDYGYGLPVVLWVCNGSEFLCDGGGSVNE